MGILIIILLIVAAFAVSFCIEWRQRDKNTMLKAIVHSVGPKPTMRWYQTYTFSVKGQHVKIDASSTDKAWEQVRRLGLGDAFLISESAQKCEVKYKA